MRTAWRDARMGAMVAVLLAMPATTLAQSGPVQGPPSPIAPRATTTDRATAARTEIPKVEPGNVAAEAATAVKPTEPTTGAPDTRENVASSPLGGDGKGSASPAYDAGKSGPLTKLPADPRVGQPQNSWQLQPQVTPVGREAFWMTNWILNPFMIGISLFVMGLLGWVIYRYRAAANPVASRTSHNTTVEVIWTLVPVLILVGIAVPSFRLLANQYDPPKAGLTIKAIGNQWYWEYEYPDYGNFTFDAVMVSDKESAANKTPRLLDTDNRVVVPVNTTVKVLTTAKDVIHGWMIPAFWVQMDAVPGRINETWFKAEKEGVYFGQCYQICGTKHGFMPIAIEVVSQKRFLAWVRAKQQENGIDPVGPGIAAPAAAPAPATAA